MSADMSIWKLVADASFLVQLVMLLLVVLSILAWAIVGQKTLLLKKAMSRSIEFEDEFWSGGDLASIYNASLKQGKNAQGMDGIFQAGYREYSRMRKQPGVDAFAAVDAAQRAMRIAVSREVDQLELHLPFLATVGSTSPYIGLFGTVWGIMNSFRALGGQTTATLSAVAPGIAEALIATAIGLFAAIPAVVAYNKFSTQVDRLVNRYETFSEEFISILQRQAHVNKGQQSNVE